MFSFSTPSSPASSRNFYYRRSEGVTRPFELDSSTPIDLLDRTSLLRRVAPTATPFPRHHLLERHTAAVEYTASPQNRLSSCSLKQDASCHVHENYESPRPISVVPASGWSFRQECKVSHSNRMAVGFYIFWMPITSICKSPIFGWCL